MKFNIVLLGDGLRKAENGFKGQGKWKLYKCFLNHKEGYGEFYLNLNEKDHTGEIVMKDTNYGDFLAREFYKEMEGITDEEEKKWQEMMEFSEDHNFYPDEDGNYDS